MIRTKVNRPQGSKVFIGIDNGVSGSIGWVDASGEHGHVKTPIFRTINYQKVEKHLNRVSVPEFRKVIRRIMRFHKNSIAVIERPMINPTRFQASLSAIRALEATLIVLEGLGIPHMFADSKEWQKAMLPAGVKGSDKLKKASLGIGQRLFPQLAGQFKGDADGILIAEWAKRANL